MAKLKPHVLLIAYHFPPSQAMGGIRPYRFYKYLKRTGYLCHVITASEQGDECPADVTFVVDKLRAIWESQTKQKLSFRARLELLIRKLMFPGQMGIIWSLDVARHCRLIIQNNPQQEFSVICTYPPLGVLLAGLIVCLRDRVPWIADFRDPIAGLVWQDTLGYTRVWDHLLESLVFRTASAVIANVEGAAAIWRERYPRARGKLHVITNGFDPEDQPRAREIPDGPEKMMVHAGALYHGRNPNSVVESVSRLRSKGRPEVSSVRILLVGAIAGNANLDHTLYDKAQCDGWLELRPTVPKHESLRTIAEADWLLLLQPQSDIQIPGKLFEYICIGRPILAVLHRSSSVKQILANSGVPHVCIYADDVPDVIDQKLTAFLRLPTSPTTYSDWFRTSFDAEYQTGQLSSIIDAIHRPRASGAREE